MKKGPGRTGLDDPAKGEYLTDEHWRRAANLACQCVGFGSKVRPVGS